MPPACDVVVVGGGPAGAIAALVLARAGARVTIFDRARFPRHKLCGDSVNPGAMALLERLGVDAAAGDHPIHGMIVTGVGGVRIDGRYPPGVTGRSVLRRDLDHALLNAAAAAGVRVEEGVLVRDVVTSGTCVEGVEISSGSGSSGRVSSRTVIAADGRQSRLARSLGVGAAPAQPRRWAVGGYFTDVHGLTDCGEMHIRRDRYIGVAPLENGLANLCVVTADRSAVRDGAGLLRATIAREPELSGRFATARLVGPPVILGPLALECRAAGMPGLLLAGDAAGFIDPMTGDGLRFAIRGAELAAREALTALEHGIADAHLRLLRARRREFGAKWRFNRALRVLAGSPSAVRLAAGAAGLVPSWVERSILYAGDVAIARPVHA
jgi:geranylgeranyl reductase family protein